MRLVETVGPDRHLIFSPLSGAVHLATDADLAWLAALAQIAEAERQVIACCRARFDDIAGPLPDALELNDDLVNATLLTTDIEQNRRLLLRLLRAHLAGEHDWRERHPTNEAFLAGLAAQGLEPPPGSRNTRAGTPAPERRDRRRTCGWSMTRCTSFTWATISRPI